ncbi:MAG: hypothetical protein HC822_23880 [Oscillochloris sp.]|nr:hypothetical protein [Oscillochloris sp.]
MMRRRTFLIGLDGATFAVLDPLMQAGVMPALAELAADGYTAVLRSIVPALTPPAWVSMATGRSPGAHGVFNFLGPVGPDDPHLRLTTSADIGIPAIWDLAGAAGLRTTLLNYPMTFPAPPIAGSVVPGGWVPWRQLRLACYPDTLYDRLKALPGFNPRELAMDAAHEARALEGCAREEYGDWIDLHTRRERQWLNVLLHLEDHDPADLVAIVFDGVDKLQHLCWPFIDPNALLNPDPWEREMRARCLSYFRELDAIIGTIVERAGPDATIVLASDHGFGPQQRTFFVNAWLREQGLLAWNDSAPPQAAPTHRLGLNEAARHVYQLDWQRTRAYCALPGGNGIVVLRAGPERPNGVPEAEYADFCANLRRALLELRDPLGVPVVQAVHLRDEVFAGPYGALAPDLTLELSDGGLVSVLDAPQAVLLRERPTGTHRPEGVLIAAGPAIRMDEPRGQASLLDVAPLLLHSLGITPPADLERPLPAHMLRELAATRAVGAIPTIQAPGRGASDLSDAEHDEVVQRLRALGYLE